MVARDRNRAGGNRRIDEARAVGLVACEREEADRTHGFTARLSTGKT